MAHADWTHWIQPSVANRNASLVVYALFCNYLRVVTISLPDRVTFGLEVSNPPFRLSRRGAGEGLEDGLSTVFCPVQ